VRDWGPTEIITKTINGSVGVVVARLTDLVEARGMKVFVGHCCVEAARGCQALLDSDEAASSGVEMA
jgi:hypothetical protein